MKLPLDSIIQGNCVEVLAGLPDKCVDMVFADPPYNLQLSHDLWRPNQTKVAAVDDAWDKFSDTGEYDKFCRSWLGECRRVLKDTGTIWVIGTYHNIFRIGAIMQDLGFWILNDIVWIKTNPMPNFRGVRFTNAHETLVWAQKTPQSRYTFNHHAMKMLNDEKQMRSDWTLPICFGKERLTEDGKKSHSTQKPAALLYRVISSSTNPGDVILDPFFGSGTTGAVAKLLHRHWIGIEREEAYIQVARSRIDAIEWQEQEKFLFCTPNRRQSDRIPFGVLLEQGQLDIGQRLFSAKRKYSAVICADGSLLADTDIRGSIHKVGALLQNTPACNGWDFWHYESEGRLIKIDDLREEYRKLSQRDVREAKG